QDDFVSIYKNLLNVLPDPAIVLDINSKEIIHYNANFLKITSYSPDELVSLPINSLFDIELILKSDFVEPFPLELTKRNKQTIEGYAWKYNFDDKNSKIIILFSEEQIFVEKQKAWQDQLFQTITQILRLIEAEDLITSLQMAVNCLEKFFETPHITIYQVNSESPELIRIPGDIESDILPFTLPSSDIQLDPKTNIWVPGQRVHTELHKIARISNLSYLATSALGPGKSASALLVVGKHNKQPPKNLFSIMEMFASAISSNLQYFILVDALRKKIEQQDWVINVNNELLDHVQDGVIILKPDLHIWMINPSAEILLGYQQREVTEKTIENILIGPDNFFPLLESAKTDFELHRLGIVHIHNRNGDSVPVDARIVPVTKDNELLSIIIYLRDVSENEEIKTRAQQLEHRAVLGEFTAVFAHEVRNPINNISMGLQILSRSFVDDVKNKEMVDRMIHDCDRLTHQMEAVLAFSKPFDAKFESVDIVLLLQRIMDRWKPRMARVGVEEFVQKAEGLPSITADPRLLEQVFTNLIGNAVEAMSTEQKGTLAVHIDISRSISNYPQIEIKVIDSGPGIPEEVRGHIFEPFVTTKKTGTGLGLAISKRIITAHRGNITVESYPGGGTVFAVYLPIKQGE
ncbi:MAG TPA: ATP-binding protein, partial [Anaerolineaceae bacterium]|nr:ATP-binding protein [Anaerolineaceae bacterium]